MTDCLNFGNPERPEVYYQLEECIKGMAEGGVMGAIGALTNAVNDALAPFDVVVNQQPLTPMYLRDLLREKTNFIHKA